MKRDPKEMMMPFIAALTTLLWGETALELATKGGIHSPDNLTGLYLTLMGAYAGTSEIQKWLQKEPADPADDPWLERINRGGFFVGLWFVPLIAAYCLRLRDVSFPMPPHVEQVTSGLVVLFFAKAASRRIRHTRRGIGGPQADSDDERTPANPSLSDELFEKLSHAPEGLGPVELQAAFPDIGRRHLFRTLGALLEGKRIERVGRAYSKDVRYRSRSLS